MTWFARYGASAAEVIKLLMQSRPESHYGSQWFEVISRRSLTQGRQGALSPGALGSMANTLNTMTATAGGSAAAGGYGAAGGSGGAGAVQRPSTAPTDLRPSAPGSQELTLCRVLVQIHEVS